MANTNYCIYPTQYINWSQGWGPNTSSHASHEDYPFDECCRPMETGETRSWLYCPCDEIEVKAIYGVNNSSHANVIIFQSTSKVLMPCGEDYITFLVIHPEDEDLNSYNIGTKFTRGQQICREGTDASPGITVSGPHFHISCAKGSYNQSMSYYYQFLSSDGYNQITPYEAFYINDKFTDYNYYTTEFVQAQNISESQFIKLSSVTNSVTAAPNYSSTSNATTTTTISATPVALQELSTPWKGVDISDSGLSISQLKSMGYDFLICRIGITGQTGQGAIESNMRKDTDFDRLYQEAKAANFPIGGYWFSCAVDAEGGKREAEKVYEYIKGKTFEMPIFIDVEDDKKYGDGLQENASSEGIAAAIQSFCDTLANKSEHYLTGVYIGYHFKGDGFIEKYNLDTKYVYWYPQWPNNSGIAHTGGAYDYSEYGQRVKVGLWQCDGDVMVTSSDDVDNDYCYYDYPTYIKTNGYNGYTGNGSAGYSTGTITTQEPEIITYYYIKKPDTSEVLKTFTNKSEAIAYIDSEKSKGNELYIYDENNTVIYPKVNLYSVTDSATINEKTTIIGKCIKFETALFLALTNQQIANSIELNKHFYIFNSNNQLLYCADQNYYVLCSKIDSNSTQKDFENHIIFGDIFLKRVQEKWLELNNIEYNVYKIYSPFQLSSKEILRQEFNNNQLTRNYYNYKKIVPFDYQYLIIQTNSSKKDSEQLYNTTMGEPITEQFINQIDNRINSIAKYNYKTNNINLAKNFCKKLYKLIGPKYEVYNINTMTTIFNPAPEHIYTGDIVGIVGDLETRYIVTETEFIDTNKIYYYTLKKETDNTEISNQYTKNNLYVISSPFQNSNIFYINVLNIYPRIKQDNKLTIANTSLTYTFNTIVPIGDAEFIDNDLYFIEETKSDKKYYFNSMYLNSIIPNESS